MLLRILFACNLINLIALVDAILQLHLDADILVCNLTTLVALAANTAFAKRPFKPILRLAHLPLSMQARYDGA